MDSAKDNKLEDIFNPVKKVWDPFGEFKGHDFEKNKESSKPKDPIDRFVEQHNYFHNSSRKEVLDLRTGKYVKYTGNNGACSNSNRNKDVPDLSEKNIPEIRNGYYL